jgi:hypothetical protein
MAQTSRSERLRRARRKHSECELVACVELKCNGNSWFVDVALGTSFERIGPYSDIKVVMKQAERWITTQLMIEADRYKTTH